MARCRPRSLAASTSNRRTLCGRRRRLSRRAPSASGGSHWSTRPIAAGSKPDTTRSSGRAASIRPAPVMASNRAIDCAVRRDAGAAQCPCAQSASGGKDLSTSVPDLEPLSHDPDTTRACDAVDLRRSRRRRTIDARFDRDAGAIAPVCPLSVRRHVPLDTSHTLSVLSGHPDPDTRRQCDRTTTQLTCSPDCSDALFDRTGRRACSCARAASSRSECAIGVPWAAYSELLFTSRPGEAARNINDST